MIDSPRLVPQQAQSVLKQQVYRILRKSSGWCTEERDALHAPSRTETETIDYRVICHNDSRGLMGVQGLTTFVEENRHILQDVRFRDSRLVIDGCSLYFRLYFDHFLDQQHGGDYDAFASLLHQFFSCLAACDIHPFVVLDGGVDPSDKKFNTICHRLQSRIRDADGLAQGRRKSVLPALTRDVFVQVLYQLRVPLVQCPFEADSEIACLAYQWKCPVLTNDSDFYIFDLPGGYLPFTFFQWSHLKGKADQRYISARSYTTARLCRCFGNMNQQLLPLCAVLNGNDYCPPNERLLGLLDAQLPGGGAGKSRSSASRIERLLSWLSLFTSASAALEEISVLMGSKSGDMAHLMAGMEDYRINPKCNLDLWFSGEDGVVPWKPIAGLPEVLWLAVAEALLPSMVVDVAVTRRVMLSLQVENCRLPSGNVCAKAIRQAIYGILLRGQAVEGASEDIVGRRRRGRRGPGGASAEQQGKNQGSSAPLLVDEYDRLDLKLKINQVLAVAPRTPLPLDELREIPVAVRQGVLLEVLGVKESSLAPLPVHLKLAVAATAFWQRNAKPAPSAHQLRALLLFMVYGELSWNTQQAPQGCWAAEHHVLTSLNKLRVSSTGRQGFDIGAAHSFSQWQSCLQSAMYLNQVLLLPLPEPRLPCLYSGTLVHVLHRRLKGGQAAETLLGAAPLSSQLYCTLLVATRNRSSKPQPSATTQGRTRSRKHRGRGTGGDRGAKGAESVMGTEDVSNRFALLMNSD